MVTSHTSCDTLRTDTPCSTMVRAAHASKKARTDGRCAWSTMGMPPMVAALEPTGIATWPLPNIGASAVSGSQPPRFTTKRKRFCAPPAASAREAVALMRLGTAAATPAARAPCPRRWRNDRRVCIVASRSQ
ncbi:MAG: hypothetical protein U1F43_23025 [Myxococcota bacterium]